MKLSLFTLVAIAATVSSCSTYEGKITSYQDPDYRQGTIRRIAVFSIRNSLRAPYKARRTNTELSRAMEDKNPMIQVVSPSESLRKDNESEWEHFVNDYHSSGIANLHSLGKVSNALNIDAVMQGQLAGIRQRRATNSGAGETRVTLSFSVIETQSGKKVWEALADGVCTSHNSGPAPPIADAIEDAMRKILDNLPRL